MSKNEEPTTDPCSAKSTFSWPRFFAFALLFVVMLGGGGTLFFALGDTPYGIQLASAVSYTAAALLYGFAKNKSGIQPYLFTCPVVVGQYPRLLKRHVVFLAALIAFETIALRIKPHLSAWWLTSSGKNMTPFVIAIVLPCGALAITEILTNRAMLERAHRDRFGDPPAKDDLNQGGALSIFGRN